LFTIYYMVDDLRKHFISDVLGCGNTNILIGTLTKILML